MANIVDEARFTSEIRSRLKRIARHLANAAAHSQAACSAYNVERGDDKPDLQAAIADIEKASPILHELLEGGLKDRELKGGKS